MAYQINVLVGQKSLCPCRCRRTCIMLTKVTPFLFMHFIKGFCIKILFHSECKVLDCSSATVVTDDYLFRHSEGTKNFLGLDHPGTHRLLCGFGLMRNILTSFYGEMWLNSFPLY